MITKQERIAGCLLGGAAGDALGAPVEFMPLDRIRQEYGETGIQHYGSAYGRIGAITDDTQMTIFTFEGMLRLFNRDSLNSADEFCRLMLHAYIRWLETQGESSYTPHTKDIYNGWLRDQNELHSRRGPGGTCLSALSAHLRSISETGSYIKTAYDSPINNSKGCGGVMRSAPVGFFENISNPFDMGCLSAAITHGHPSGYLAAGFLSNMIKLILEEKTLEESIEHSIRILETYQNNEECLRAVENALLAAKETEPTPENIEKLGGGWVAEEALAISLYCALKAHDFAHGIQLAVNHTGDSDSTGAITGNILGALWGKQAIPAEFLKNLELRELLEEMAQDMFSINGDEKWWKKYPGC
ncbi:MAG: ADP-ribosylglycohydrolase family protein [Firmicutes bacterium]|nr:ADP-ribosylglycohydrolase family protein [Bacillota bacterium]